MESMGLLLRCFETAMVQLRCFKTVAEAMELLRCFNTVELEPMGHINPMALLKCFIPKEEPSLSHIPSRCNCCSTKRQYC